MNKIDDVLVSIRRVIRATDLHSKHLVKTSGLTAPQILVLQSIKDAEPVTIGLIAKKISLSQATVTSIMDRLVSKQLVYRERSIIDRRKVHAYLTEQGKCVLAQAPTPLQEKFTEQFQALEAWEQSMILASLQRVANMMGAGELDAAPLLTVTQPDAVAAVGAKAEQPLHATQITSNNMSETIK